MLTAIVGRAGELQERGIVPVPYALFGALPGAVFEAEGLRYVPSFDYFASKRRREHTPMLLDGDASCLRR